MNNNTNFVYTQVRSSLILSDPSYQREVDLNRVKRIHNNFNPDLVNPIKVSLRDGMHFVFDGQHTLEVLKMRNGYKDLMVDCKVYYGLTQQDEARLFSEQNGESRVVQTNAKLKALLTAGDVGVISMQGLVTNIGIKMDFTRGIAQNKIIACGTVYKIFKKTTAAEFIEILGIIKESWGGDADSFRREILEGVFLFYSVYRAQYSKKIAFNQFAKVSPLIIIREANVYTQGGSTRYARQLLKAYNANLRTNRLDDIL